MSTKSINAILSLKDNMSKPILNITSKTKALIKETKKMTNEEKAFNVQAKKMSRETKKASNAINNFGKKSVKAIDNMVKRAAQFGTIMAGVGVVALFKQADAYSEIQARLSLINDGQQTVQEFNKKIFKSANDARVSYTDIAGTVAKLGVVAKNAFSGNDEILKFSTLLSKSFKIGGSSAEEQSSAILQLTQAMGSGRLQGDEFRSIMENAPMVAQAIAKEMGVTTGQLKEMSSQGLISSDIIKKALFNSADEINKKFDKMPMKFGEVVTKMKSKLTEKLQPTFERMSQWLNSAKGQAEMDKFVDSMGRAVDGAKKVIDKLILMKKWVDKNKGSIEFLLSTIAGFYVAIKTIGAVELAIKALSRSFVIANGTLALTPFGAMLITLGAVASAIIYVCTHLDELKKMWEDFKKNGIKKGSLNTIDKRERLKSGLPAAELPLPKTKDREALGTSYWKGGLTHINEQGGEIIDLPNGSRVTPADKSKKMMEGNKNNTFNIAINGVGKSTDEIVGELVPKLKLAMANM